MDRRINIIFLLTIISCGCNKHEVRLCNELSNISKTVALHTKEPRTMLEISNLVIPKRYHEMHTLYFEMKKEMNILTNCVDSLLKNDLYTLSYFDIKRFEHFYTTIDSLYIPRLDTVKGGDNLGNNYQYTQLTYLDKFIEPLKEKVEHSASRHDLEFIKLYLMLIDREALAFIHEEAKDYTVPINLLKPITIRDGNYINCYLAAVDTCNYPYILIGKFDHIKLDDNDVYYKKISIYDTIYFKLEKARIDMNAIKGYEAIAIFIGPHGELIQFKIM
jgi:hypothetical protein